MRDPRGPFFEDIMKDIHWHLERSLPKERVLCVGDSHFCDNAFDIAFSCEKVPVGVVTELDGPDAVIACYGAKTIEPYKFEGIEYYGTPEVCKLSYQGPFASWGYLDEVCQIDGDRLKVMNDEINRAMLECQERFNRQYFGMDLAFAESMAVSHVDEPLTWNELMESARQEERDTDPGIGPNTLSIPFDEEKTPTAVVKPKRRANKCYSCLVPNPALVQDTYQFQRTRAINCPGGCVYPEIEE